MATLLDLANRMDALRKSVPKAASNYAAEVASNIQQLLVWNTPVDTSEALTNWVLTVGEQWAVPLDPYYYGEHGSTQQQSAEAALQQGRQQLALKQPGQPIFLTNNAPHIRLLNDGHSLQAPAGFVERDIMAGLTKARSVGIKLKVNGHYV